MRAWCWDHSLTIALTLITLLAWGGGVWIENARLYDFVMNLGHDAASAAIIFIFSAWLYERNKPDEPPEALK